MTARAHARETVSVRKFTKEVDVSHVAGEFTAFDGCNGPESLRKIHRLPDDPTVRPTVSFKISTRYRPEEDSLEIT